MMNKENTIVYLGKDKFSERKNEVGRIWNCNVDEEIQEDDTYDVVYWIEELSYYQKNGEKKIVDTNILDYDYLENMGILLKQNRHKYIISYEEFIRIFDTNQ